MYEGDRNCLICPLAGVAWYTNHFSCVSECTFYYKWFNANDTTDRVYWANRMVYACNQAIERLLCGTASTMNQIMTV